VTTNFSGFSSDEASAVAIQNGKIVVGGTTDAPGSSAFALARYKSNGALDSGFGKGGKVTTEVGEGFSVLTALAIQSDGKVVAAGFASGPDDFDFAMARYTPNGSLDPGFGIGGIVITNLRSEDLAQAVAIQSDGKIVVAGIADGDVGHFGLARYTSNGFLDPTFGEGGKVVTDLSGFDTTDIALGLAIQSDGKLVVAGFSKANSAFPDFALARYNPGGCLDAGFGTGGAVTTDFRGIDVATAVVIQTDGKIVAAGFSVTPGDSNFALARYLPGEDLGTACGF
jgi:uncharacterized delta-60 repeat protein